MKDNVEFSKVKKKVVLSVKFTSSRVNIKIGHNPKHFDGKSISPQIGLTSTFSFTFEERNIKRSKETDEIKVLPNLTGNNILFGIHFIV